VLAIHQLAPELALDFSRASLVILIDAGADNPPGEISVQSLAPDVDAGVSGGAPGAPMVRARPPITSVPPSCSRLARALYGAAPAALVVRVGVAEMEIGEALSPAVSAALPAVADVVVASRTSSSVGGLGPVTNQGMEPAGTPDPGTIFAAGVSFPFRSRERSVTRRRCTERPTTRHARGIMARSMWRGAIQFGLVTIPVRLYLATDSKGIAFNMLHASCLNGSR